MISALVKYKTINQYLEAAGCLNRTGIEEFFILKFSELSVSTARRMEACLPGVVTLFDRATETRNLQHETHNDKYIL